MPVVCQIQGTLGLSGTPLCVGAEYQYDIKE